MKKFEGNPGYDDIIGGRVKMVDGVWYWTEWHVAYAQGPMDTSDNFVTREDAEAYFEKRLADIRQGFSYVGRGKPPAKFSESHEDRLNGGKSIRFRSIRKNGKPGALTGLLYMDKINRE